MQWPTRHTASTEHSLTFRVRTMLSFREVQASLLVGWLVGCFSAEIRLYQRRRQACNYGSRYLPWQRNPCTAIANPLSNAQLGGIFYHSPNLQPGPCNSVGMRPRTERQTQTRVTTIHFASSTTHAKVNVTAVGSGFLRLRVYETLTVYSR